MKEHPLAPIAHRLAGTVRTAGRIEFVRDQGPVRRDLRVQNFRWDPEVHRNLAKILWASERSHSYGMAALRLFSRMTSSDFSPDGLLGGRGYIQQVKEMRASLSQAVEVLSSFTDTLHDEVNADHWASAIEQSPSNEEIVAEVNTEPGYVEEQFHQEVPGAPEGLEMYENPEPGDYNPFSDLEDRNAPDPFEEADEDWDWTRTSAVIDGQEIPLEGPRSQLPTDPFEPKEGLDDEEAIMNTTGEDPRGNYADPFPNYASAISRAMGRKASDQTADSSVDPATLPGPRVMHVGPGESPEEFGYFTDQDEVPSDDPIGEGFSQFELIYNGPGSDGGATEGYPSTHGDETTFKPIAARLARLAYSWLPGSRNEKLVPIYDPFLTAEEVEYLRANDAPDPPVGMVPAPRKPEQDPLWDAAKYAL